MLLPYKYFNNSNCTWLYNKKLGVSLFFGRKVITFIQLDFVLNRFISRIILDFICYIAILCYNREF